MKEDIEEPIMDEPVDYSPDIPSDDKFVNRGNAIVAWIDKGLKLLSKEYRWLRILKNLAMMCIIAIAVWFLVFPKKFVNHITNLRDAVHEEKLQRSLDVRVDIQKCLDNIIDYTSARSATLFELHNTQVGFGGIPFVYASPSMESLRQDINSFAKDLKDVNLAMIRAAQISYKDGVAQGYVSDLKNDDKYLYGLLSAPGITYYAMFLVPGDHLPIAFLVVAYDEKPNSFNVEQRTAYAIAEKLRYR
jgi:hypothetical protein